MYQHVLNQLREVVGSKAPYALAAGTVVLVVALILLLLPPWRRFARQCMERGGRRGILVGTISVVLALVVGATVIEVLRGSLLVQSKEFDRTHGRKSETNLGAVRTIWGSPLELRELQVTHFITEEKIVFQYKDGRQVPQEELQALSPEDLLESDDIGAGDAEPAAPEPRAAPPSAPPAAPPRSVQPAPPLPSAPPPAPAGPTAPAAPAAPLLPTAPAAPGVPQGAVPPDRPESPAGAAAQSAIRDPQSAIDAAPVGVLFQAPRSSGDQAADKPIKRKIKVRRAIPQNSIVRGKVDVDLRLNYRPMGSAYYTCYATAWKLDYTVKNRSKVTTDAEFRLAQDRTYNNLAILVDGKALKTEDLMYRGGAQTWSMPMTPGQEVKVAISFDATGMDHIRYIFASMAMREDYNVTMRVLPCVQTKDEPARGQQQLSRRNISPAMGAMPATRIEDAAAAGEPMVLAWNLKSAATNQDVGVRLPEERSEGYLHCGRLLREAPMGIVLLVGALVISWMLLGRQTELFSLVYLAVAYYLFYTLIGYLTDVIPSFAGSFVVAGAASLVLAGLYVWLGWGRSFAAHQTMALAAVFVIYYPLAVTSLGATSEDYSGLMLQILYWGLAAYAALLAVARVRRIRREAASA